jgi:hypothetical protein
MVQRHRRRNLFRIWQARPDRAEALRTAALADRAEAEAARRRLLEQAAVIPEPAGRIYWSRPLFTPGQAYRGHGGRP